MYIFYLIDLYRTFAVSFAIYTKVFVCIECKKYTKYEMIIHDMIMYYNLFFYSALSSLEAELADASFFAIGFLRLEFALRVTHIKSPPRIPLTLETSCL